MLDKLWDDVVAGPQPDHGLGKLRKAATTSRPPSLTINTDLEGEGSKYKTSASAMPQTPPTPATPVTPNTTPKSNVWRSVFHPGSNLATRSVGANLFDRPQPNSPTVYDWLYSGETKSSHR